MKDLLNVNLEKVIYKRGLLGFAGQYEFQKVSSVQRGNFKIKKLMFSVSATGTDRYIDTNTGQEKQAQIEIKRFPSPITYLVDEKKIYMIIRADYIKQLINYNPTVTLTLKCDGKEDGTKFNLRLPSSFDAEDFFDEVAKMPIPSTRKMGYVYKLKRLR